MKFTLIAIGIVVSTVASAQEFNRSTLDPARIADELAAFQDEDVSYEELYENYLQLYANPIDLNKCTDEDLRLLHILDESQIKSFLAYRLQNGPLLSVYELQAIPEFDLPTIEKLVGFVFVSDSKSNLNRSLISRIASLNNTYLVTRYERTIQKKKGFQEIEDAASRFKGSADELYLRFRSSQPKDYSIGFTIEKDAGEEMRFAPRKKQYGADYLSYHVQLSEKKRLKNLILGDYQCSFGQGLIAGGAFGLGKGGETINTVRKANIGFLPYTSVNEAGMLKGVAGTYQITSDLYFSGFYSSSYRDANIDTSSSAFTSFSTTGLHRNVNEITRRKQLHETIYGGVLNYKYKSLDAGVIVQRFSLGSEWQRTLTPYNQLAFRGDDNINTGVFANYQVNNISLFTEAAKSLKGGIGFVAGALASLTSQLDIALVLRNYERDYYSFYSNAFSENTTPQNERGMYWGWKYKFNRRYTLSGYADLFQFSWLKFRTYRPSVGHELLYRFSYQPSRKTLAFIQYRYESKERNNAESSAHYMVSETAKQNLWISFDYELFPRLRMKSRAQFSQFHSTENVTNGMVLLQDLSYSFEKIQCTLRHAIFETDDFDNRQYVYENDVWLAYSLPAYYGRGLRNYILLEYKLNRQFSLWMRYSQSVYRDREEIGSGVDVTNGSKVSEVKVQMRMKI
jgi:hypothetical protein